VALPVRAVVSTAKGPRAVSERDVEAYLKDQVELHGGKCILLSPRGTRGVYDANCIWPRHGWAKVDPVEVKTIGGALEPWQERLHTELAKLNCRVRVIWTKAEVDAYVRESTAHLRAPLL
jgi:hypothetical protein